MDPATNTTTASLPLEEFRPDIIGLGAEGTSSKLSRALASAAGRAGAPSEALMLSTTEVSVYDEAMLMMLQTLAALEAQGLAAAAAVEGEGTKALDDASGGDQVDETGSAIVTPTFASLYDDASAAMHLALERCEQQGGGGGGTEGGAGGSGRGSGGGGGGSARDALARLCSAARTTAAAPCSSSGGSTSGTPRGGDEISPEEAREISAAMVEDNVSALTRVTPLVEAAAFADPIARHIAHALPSRHRTLEATATATAVVTTGGPVEGDVTTHAASRWAAAAAGAALPLDEDGLADVEGEAEAAEAADAVDGWAERFTRWQAELREQRMEYEAASRSSWKFHARKEMVVPIMQMGGHATVREYLNDSDRLVRMIYSDEQVHQVRVELYLLP